MDSFRESTSGLPAVVPRAKSACRGGGSNSVVESQPSKLLVAGSIPVSRSILRRTLAALAASDGRPETADERVASRLVADLSAEAASEASA